MKQEGLTVRQAAEWWVNEFNAIPTDMISKLWKYEPDDWEEVTAPTEGDRVYEYESYNEYGYLQERRERCEDGEEQWFICFDSGEQAWVCIEDFEVVRDEVLPMWGTMWSFHDWCDTYWVENMDGIQVLSDCGFRVYYSEEFGYFFGVDGAGYDFYEYHWVPLYTKRGLQWHDPKTLAALIGI